MPAAAQNDFDLLLSELTFGEAKPPAESTLDEAPEGEVSGPAGELTLPTEAGPAEPLSQSDRPEPELDSEPAAANRQPVQQARPLQLDEPSSLPDPVRIPEPGAEPQAADPAAATPEPEDGQALPADEAMNHPGFGGHHGGHAGAAYCRPHHPPTLPPPSSLLQYFRSRPCYSDVWAGYAADRHQLCELYHQHLHGTCDCFKPRKHRLGCAPKLYRPDCGHCGGCDQNQPCDCGHHVR